MRWPARARLVLAGLPLVLAASCATVPSPRLVQDTAYRDTSLDPDAITLMSWNIEKGHARHWPAVHSDTRLRARLADADLLLLQEACAAPGMHVASLADLLHAHGYGWSLTVGFESAPLGCGGNIATGVMTASRARPVAVVPLRSRHREFGLTPKTALARTFALRGRGETLLLINAHLLNFEWFDTGDVAAQLARIGKRIAAHHGPVILAGDLNTRNTGRLAQVQRLTTRYGLRPVFGAAPAGCTQSIFGRGYALDHFYCRKKLQFVVFHVLFNFGGEPID